MNSHSGSPVKDRSRFFENFTQNSNAGSTRTLTQVSPSKVNSNSPRGSSKQLHKSQTKKGLSDIAGNAKAPSTGSGIANNPFLLQNVSNKKTPDTGSKSSPSKNKISESHHIFGVKPASLSSPNQAKVDVLSNNDKEHSVLQKTVDVSKMPRETLKYYEFLCRVSEAKKWIEEVIGEELPGPLDLSVGDAMRDGFYLAKVAQTIKPDIIMHIIPPGRLQYKHTQNINAFFSLVDEFEVPSLFRFELTDLYEKKDVPKVFETLHALVNIINSKLPGKVPEIQNLSGNIVFSEDDIKKCRLRLPHVRNFRSFKAEIKHFQGKEKQYIKEDPTDREPTVSDQDSIVEPVSSPKFATESLKVKQEVEATSVKSDKKTPAEEPELNTETDTQAHENNKVEKADEPLEFPKLEDTNIPQLKADADCVGPQSPHTPERVHDSLSPYPSNYSTSPYRPSSYRGSRTASMLFSDPLLRNSALLSYSPTKTFSYYSPGISRKISYKTDSSFYSAEPGYASPRYNNYPSGLPVYSPARRQRMSEAQFLDTIICIQAYSKGFSLRYDIYMKKKTLELFTDSIIGIQSVAKAVTARKQVSRKLGLSSSPECGGLDQLKAIVKASKYRTQLDKIQLQCLKNDLIIRHFQVIARCLVIRRQNNAELMNIVACNEPLRKFQALVRGQIVRSKFSSCISNLRSLEDIVIMFQSHVCRIGVKKRYNLTVDNLLLSGRSLEELQSTLKGIVERQRIKQMQYALESLNYIVLRFTGRIRGGYLRNNLYPAKYDHDTMNAATFFQARVKGILARFAIDLINDVVEDNLITNFQAIATGNLVRFSVRSNQRYYRRNVASIIKVQSAIRSHQIKIAYREIFTASSPTLWAVRKFVHVLNENETDTYYKQLHNMKIKVNECNGSIKKLRDEVQILIKKLRHLERRNIHPTRFLSDSGVRNLDKFSAEVSGDKLKRETSLYEQICYLLQVDPFYWKLLIKAEPKNCLNFLPKLFAPTGTLLPHRENLLFIKLIGDLMTSQMEELPSSKLLSRSPTESSWEYLLAGYLRRHKGFALRTLLSKTLELLNDPDLDFESVPATIYSKLHPTMPAVVSHVAIDDPATNSKYIKNMTDIWRAAESVRAALTTMMDEVPIEIRYLCTKAYKCFADKSSDDITPLRAICKILISQFVNEFFKQREHYTNEEKSFGIDNKIEVLCQTLLTIFSFKRFTGYFTPLNSYLKDIGQNVAYLLRSVLVPLDFEQECNSVVFRDMHSSERPKMTIKLQYLDKIIRTYISHMNILPHDDALLGLLKDMERHYENALTGNTGIISIQLDPTVYRVPLEDDRIALMYSETKRGLSYLMQVEDVDTTIADLLTSAVFPEDDIQFKQLISKYPSIGEDLAKYQLEDVEYIKFKKHVIQRVKELTQLGVIVNVNNYQSILNDIAHSIRSRPYLGSFSERELMFMTDVEDHLKKKETYLSLLLEALKTATAKAIKVTQKSQNYEPVKKIGWGKMIKEAYKKAHGYDSNFPDGVHHKWSTRVLCDRGVLQKLNGEAVNSVELNFFGSSSSKCPEVEFRISTQNGEVFNIYLIDSKKRGNYEHATLKFKDLLEKEAAEDQATISILKGNHTTFAVSPLLDLLCETFFS